MNRETVTIALVVLGVFVAAVALAYDPKGEDPQEVAAPVPLRDFDLEPVDLPAETEAEDDRERLRDVAAWNEKARRLTAEVNRQKERVLMAERYCESLADTLRLMNARPGSQGWRDYDRAHEEWVRRIEEGRACLETLKDHMAAAPGGAE